MAVDAARRDDPLALGQVAGAREGEILGHDAVADDLLGAVDVGEVGVEGVDALREAALKAQTSFFMTRGMASKGKSRSLNSPFLYRPNFTP